MNATNRSNGARVPRRSARPATRVLALACLLVLPVAAFAQSSAAGARDRIVTYQVTVTSNVRSSQVYVDRVRQPGTTPTTLTLPAGTYTIRVEARGYQVWEERVTVTGSGTIHATLAPPFAVVHFSVPSELLNDQVRDPWRLIDFFIDGRRIQPNARVEVEPGYHVVTIRTGGLRSESRLYFEAGRVYTLDVILRMDRTDRSY